MDIKTRQHRHRNRLLLILVCGLVLALAMALILFALREEIVYFRTPTEVVTGVVEPGIRVRVGGLVEEGSLLREGDLAYFKVTDQVATFSASYKGILPDLFREGQGVVMEGILSPDGYFSADMVLAKHDENYIPKEVSQALKESGQWKGEGP